MKFEWKKISGDNHSQNNTYRAKVFGGWLVKSTFIDEDFGTSICQSFISDPDHKWDIE